MVAKTPRARPTLALTVAKVALSALALTSVGCATPQTPREAADVPRAKKALGPSKAALAKRALERGTELLSQNRPRAARAVFRDALALDPLRYEAHHQLGRCHYELGEYALEQVEYQKCLAISPRYADAWRSLGNARFAADDLVNAQVAYRRYLELAPRDTAVIFNLAQIAEDLGDAAEAKLLFARCRELRRQTLDPSLPPRRAGE